MKFNAKKEMERLEVSIENLRVDAAISIVGMIKDMTFEEAMEFVITGGSNIAEDDDEFLANYVDTYGEEDFMDTIKQITKINKELQVPAELLILGEKPRATFL